MVILQYRGKSLISRLIRFQTRSIHSHTAVQLSDGRVVEAWTKGGVRVVDSFRDRHTKGTIVDVYMIVPQFNEIDTEQFLLDQVGKSYDFKSIWRFLSKRTAPANDKWFCSELALAAIARGGLNLLNGNFSNMSPAVVPFSPLLKKVDEWVA